jgi:S1-C subfamily serine protease
MGRKGWLIAVVAVLLIVGSIVALTMLTGQAAYRNMQGPVAIVSGPAPSNGFLGVGFTSDALGPATISHVVAGSGAAEAGLKEGDVIVAVGDVKDPTSLAVQRATVNTKPGDQLALRIRHGDGAEKDVSVRLISLQEMMTLTTAEAEQSRAAATSRSSRPAN